MIEKSLVKKAIREKKACCGKCPCAKTATVKSDGKFHSGTVLQALKASVKVLIKCEGSHGQMVKPFNKASSHEECPRYNRHQKKLIRQEG